MNVKSPEYKKFAANREINVLKQEVQNYLNFAKETKETAERYMLCHERWLKRAKNKEILIKKLENSL